MLNPPKRELVPRAASLRFDSAVLGPMFSLGCGSRRAEAIFSPVAKRGVPSERASRSIAAINRRENPRLGDKPPSGAKSLLQPIRSCLEPALFPGRHIRLATHGRSIQKCHKRSWPLASSLHQRLCDFSGGLDKALCHHPHDSHSYPPAGRHYGCRSRSTRRNRGSTVDWLRTWSILPHFHQQGEPSHSELVPLNSRFRDTYPRSCMAGLAGFPRECALASARRTEMIGSRRALSLASSPAARAT